MRYRIQPRDSDLSQPAIGVRICKLIGLGLVVSFAIYLGVNIALAFVYTSAFTLVPCPANPRPPAGLPSPTEVFLQTRDGLAVPAWYFPPTNGAVIIALDGPRGAIGSGVPPIDFLVRQGFGVLQIGSRACVKPKRAAVTLGGKELWDVEAALHFLKTQPFVNRIGVFGFSMGGATAIRSAARYPEIEAIIAEGGYFNLGEDIVEPDLLEPIARKVFLYTVAFALWTQTGVNPWELSPVDDLPMISPRPVYLIYGEHEIASGRGALQYQAARQPKDLWIVPGGGHGRNHLVAPEEYQQRVSTFFIETLLNNAPAVQQPAK